MPPEKNKIKAQKYALLTSKASLCSVRYERTGLKLFVYYSLYPERIKP